MSMRAVYDAISNFCDLLIPLSNMNNIRTSPTESGIRFYLDDDIIIEIENLVFLSQNSDFSDCNIFVYNQIKPMKPSIMIRHDDVWFCNDWYNISYFDDDYKEMAIARQLFWYLTGVRNPIKANVFGTINFDSKHLTRSDVYSNIKKVIFNDPATIVYWHDGDKTVVKCSDNDTFSEETGLVMAINKKLFGEDYYNKVKKIVKKFKKGD